MQLNRSYDELDSLDSLDIESSNIESQPYQKGKVSKKIGRQVLWFWLKAFGYLLAVCGWFILIWLCIQTDPNHERELGYKYLEQDSRRQLRASSWIHKHDDPCKKSRYGCCQIYTAKHTYTFEGYYQAIPKHDKEGSNCLSLYQLLHDHNHQFMNQYMNCLKELNKTKCCEVDIYPDMMKRHKNLMVNNTQYKNFWKKNRYQYLLDYKNKGCPSILQIMVEKTDTCVDRYNKYGDCNYESNCIMLLLIFLLLFILGLSSFCNCDRRKS